VETFPQTLEKQVRAAKESVSERLTSDFEKDRALMESKFEGEKNVLKGGIESLEKMTKVQTSQIEELSRKHEQAYEKVHSGYRQSSRSCCKTGDYFGALQTWFYR
jgi:hypothetical protein